MGFFSRQPPPKVIDPELGTFTLDKFGWNGGRVMCTADGTVIRVSVQRIEPPPQETERNAVLEFVRQYEKLTPELKAALFALWESSLDDTDWEVPIPADSDALWAMLEIEMATVMRSGALELMYAFKGEFWPDAMFFVELCDGKVIPRSLDD